MSAELSHQQIEAMLGAFALDAIGHEESATIELHLRGCPRCRAEVTEHREVAALLAHTGAPAPEGVWARILEELEPTPPALRMPEVPSGATTPHGQALGSSADAEGDALQDAVPSSAIVPAREPGEVVDLTARRSTVPRQTLAAAIAVAAVIVAVLGFITVHQTQRLDKMDVSLRDVSVDRVASQAMSDPQAATGKLTSGDGRVNAPVVVNAEGKGYLLATKLPELPRNRTYQLWGRIRGSVVSLGVFDGRTDVVPFQLGSSERDDVSGFAVTAEASPGVSVSKRKAVLSGTI